MNAIRNGKEIRGTERLDCDVLVIGSGAGGAAAAYELARAGRNVIVLEAGPHVRSQDFHAARARHDHPPLDSPEQCHPLPPRVAALGARAVKLHVSRSELLRAARSAPRFSE
jgi:choline dehydrogenase-like flavoprotein